MDNEKDKFISYLKNQVRGESGQYKESTIDAYANSINLITEDLNNNFNLHLKSLYDEVDTSVLLEYFDKLFNLPHVIESERIQRKRKTNGFKRYIEFRKFENELSNNENQPVIFDTQESQTEGGEKIIISKVAERVGKLRAQAIKIHGLTCKACGFNFFEKYGKIGKDFIEIHHLKKLKPNHGFVVVETNPETDLIPLCSNCHRVVHMKRNLTLSLEALIELIRENVK